MRGIEYSQLGREVDQLGDVFLTYHNRSKRHNGVVGVLARAARQALNAKVQTEDMQHEVYSPGARPDVRIRLRTRKFKLLEVKVICPISSNPPPTRASWGMQALCRHLRRLRQHRPRQARGGRSEVCAGQDQRARRYPVRV
jgi:hypothetical protein